ncbi:unnamed protein product [Ixodes hexagonus]
MSTEDKFYAAVEVIRGLPKNGSFQPSHDLQLKFYAYYKQATQGSVTECKVPKPRFWDIIGNAKWDAWMRLGDMSKEEAMQKYVDELVKIVKQLQATASEDQVQLAARLTASIAVKLLYYKDIFYGMRPKLLTSLLLASNKPTRAMVDPTAFFPRPRKPQHFRRPPHPTSRKYSDVPSSFPLHHPGSEGAEEHNTFENDVAKQHEDEESGSPQPREDSSMLANAVSEALRSGTDRVLVQDSESQLWAFYADNGGGGKPPNGDLANVRGGGDDPQRKTGPLPRGGPGGGGRHPRGYRRREGDLGPDGAPLDGRYGSLRGYSGGGGGGGSGRGHQRLPLEVSEQLAVAVLRLQQTMDEVVARLEVLETLLQHSKSQQNQRWWLFGGVAPHLLLLLLAWPVVFQLGLYLVSRRRLRQLRR